MTYTKKTLNEIKANIILNILNNVDTINDANIGSALDLFVTSISEELEEQYNDLDIIYEGTRISTATDTDLEEIGAIVGVDRNQGSEATGYVSFIRNSPTTTPFTININSIISTQPSAQSTDYRYLTTATTTFPASIANEEQTFVNGIYLYKLAQRFIDSITSVDGTASSSAYTFVQNTDYSIESDYEGVVIDVDEIVVIDDCETAGNWTKGDDAADPTANTSEFLEGTQSLNLIKSATTSTTLSYTNTLSPTTDMSSLNSYMNLFVKDATALGKIDNINIYVCSGGSTSNSYKINILNADLVSAEWQTHILNRTNANTVITGTPDPSNINFLKIEVILNNTTDTLAAGDLMMDFWYFSTHVDYVGDVIIFDKAQTIPDDGTTISVDYVPLSMEVPVEAEQVGVGYNASSGKIIYKVSNISNIDRIYNYDSLTGGIDVEIDDDYRVRIQNATSLKTNATVNAITYNVLDLDFIENVSVIDTPDKTITSEPHTFATGTDLYKLDHSVAQDDATLEITGTLSATPGHTFVKGTDYNLNEYNEIDWSIGGDTPDDATIYYVTYNYKWLGHFDVYVVGKSGRLTAAQLTEVEEVVDDTKAAGTVSNVIEPTYTSIDVDITLTYATGYSSSTVDDNVESAIETYINDLDIGDDVLLAGIINVIMQVTGVANVAVTDIGGGGAADYTIAINEKAQCGTITIT